MFLLFSSLFYPPALLCFTTSVTNNLVQFLISCEIFFDFCTFFHQFQNFLSHSFLHLLRFYWLYHVHLDICYYNFYSFPHILHICNYSFFINFPSCFSLASCFMLHFASLLSSIVRIGTFCFTFEKRQQLHDN